MGKRYQENGISHGLEQGRHKNLQGSSTTLASLDYTILAEYVLPRIEDGDLEPVQLPVPIFKCYLYKFPCTFVFYNVLNIYSYFT